MSTKEKIDLLWQILPYALPILAYIIGKARNAIKVPKGIQRLLNDPEVMEAVRAGVAAGKDMQGKTDAEKQEHVRAWLRSELRKYLGEWLPDSTINYLIETAIVRSK